VARLDSFLRLVAEQRASDLHFHAGNVPTIRFEGELTPLPFRVLTEQETRRFLHEILSPVQVERLERERELDLLYAVEGVGRFRANLFVQSQGLGAVFRVVPNQPLTLEELHLPPVLRTLTQLDHGLVLVTGPTGAGKSTTLAAMLHEINRTAARHIVTVEDPIEFDLRPVRAVISQRQVEDHTESFASALRAALRESPDVLVVGELRDAATAQLALNAAETGVLVFGTLHTGSAAKAVDRLLDLVPADVKDQMRAVMSVLLRGVVSQHLCRKANGEGRIALTEILLHNWAVANMIREGKTHQIAAYLKSVSYESTGMQSLDACIAERVRSGHIRLAEGLLFADEPDLLRTQVGALEE
jgi:twitching motility protein PilT